MYNFQNHKTLTSRSSQRILARSKAYSTRDLRKHRRIFSKNHIKTTTESLRLTKNLSNYSAYKAKLSEYSSEICFFKEDFQNKI